MKPVGFLSRHKEEDDLGLWVSVVVEDSEGNKFCYKTSCFKFDMEPVPEKCQTLDCNNEVSHHKDDFFYCANCFASS